MRKKYKMQFCSRCGCPLTIGLLSCQNCGTKIENPQPKQTIVRFSIAESLMGLFSMIKESIIQRKRKE